MEEVARTVRRGRRFLIATHRNPDGDALGSALSLAAGLKSLGKSVKVYNADPVPYFLRFLPGWEKVTSKLGSKEKFDASFVADCSDLSRVGEIFSGHSGLGRVVVLDHHARGPRGGDLRFVDPQAASSGVVVHRVLRRLGVNVTPGIATDLYVTVVTDTGNFRYPTTTPEVLELAAELVRRGASPDKISRALNETATPAKLKLLGLALETLELLDQGRIGIVAVTSRMLRKTGGTLEMVEDFVDYPKSLATVEVSILLREVPEGWRISLRSKEAVDVGAVAQSLGGGGHVRAAGLTLGGNLKSAKAKLVAAVRKVLQKSSIYKPKTAC